MSIAYKSIYQYNNTNMTAKYELPLASVETQPIKLTADQAAILQERGTVALDELKSDLCRGRCIAGKACSLTFLPTYNIGQFSKDKRHELSAACHDCPNPGVVPIVAKKASEHLRVCADAGEWLSLEEARERQIDKSFFHLIDDAEQLQELELAMPIHVVSIENLNDLGPNGAILAPE